MIGGPYPSVPRKALNPDRAFQSARALQLQGRLKQAAELYEAVLHANPDHFDALLHFAYVRIREGKLDDAMRLSRKSLYRKPNSPEAHNCIGIVLQARGKIEEGIHAFQKAIALKPDYVEAHFNLGTAFHSLGRYEDALRQYDKALALDPHYHQANVNRGTVLATLNRLPEARESLEHALRTPIRNVAIHNNLGNVLKEMGRHEAAITHFQKALALDPSNPDVCLNLGTSLAELGRLEEARALYEKAIELAPHRLVFYRTLFFSRRVVAGDRHLMALEKLADRDEQLLLDDRINLHFALGKAYADIGAPERSFGHFVTGNALYRRRIAYDEPGLLDTFKRLKERFTVNLVDGLAARGDESRLPIFIVGMPRSGTTLLERILSSYPGAFAAGETLDFPTAVQNVLGPDSLSYPDLIPRLTAETLRTLGSLYVKALRSRAPDQDVSRIVDKLPANFVYTGLIHLALPNARIIHARRNAVDTCVSCYSHLFTGYQPFAFDLGELGRYYRAYSELMEHWRSVLPEGTVLEVDYESVVADLEREARRIMAFCGFEWDDRCLAFERAAGPVRTASQVQVREPIYRTSVGRWRAYGNLLAPLLDALGPQIHHPG